MMTNPHEAEVAAPSVAEVVHEAMQEMAFMRSCIDSGESLNLDDRARILKVFDKLRYIGERERAEAALPAVNMQSLYESIWGSESQRHQPPAVSQSVEEAREAFIKGLKPMYLGTEDLKRLAAFERAVASKT